MSQVIKSDAESRDGVSIEREQASTAFRSMPHFVTFDVVPRPEKDSFGSFEPREAKLQEASGNDDLTGRKGLNWSQLFDVGASLRHADELTGSFDPREVKSVEIGEPPDPEIGGLEAPGNGITLDTTPPQMSMHQGAMNSVWDKDEAGNVRDAAGNTSERYRLGPGATFEDITEAIEPVPGMDSFGESLKPVPEDGGFQPLVGASVEIGQPPEPKLWLQMLG
jgi:hypothetical protein